jgi:hypothetical protein
MRIVPPAVQLELSEPDVCSPVQKWWDLPEVTRASVLALLARLIARGVLVDQAGGVKESGDE